MIDPKLQNETEATNNFFNALGHKIKKVIVPKKKKKVFNEYIALNNEIMQVVEDRQDLIQLEDNSDSILEQIEALEYTKKALEKKLVELEKGFYNVKKGLWIGVARDLMSNDYEPYLLYLPWKNLHNHFEVYGTSGYGKSRLMALILKQMIMFGWSVIAVDPKGGKLQEIPQWIYDFAAEAGRNDHVTRIMPTYPELSDRGNPIFGMSNDEICSMTASLVVTGSGTVSSDEQFFAGQVYRTTNGILLATTFLEAAAYTKKDIDMMIKTEVKKYVDFRDYKGEEYLIKNHNEEMPDIYKMSLSEVRESEDKALKLISPFNRTLITFRELSYYSNYDRLKELYELVKVYPVTSNQQALEQMRTDALRVLDEMITKEKAFFEKVGDSLSILLSQLAYGPIGTIFCETRINPLLQKIRSKEGVIVIFQPAPMRFEKVSEMMMKCYTRMYLSLFGTIGSSGRGLYKRVALIVDEAKPMMFPGIEEIYNKARQLGMTIGAFYQSKSDIVFKLGEVLADIVQDNTGTSISMKQGSENSREAVAKSYGTKKVSVNVAMKENDEMGGRSTVVQEDREIMNSADIDEFSIGEGVLKHYGKKLHVVFPYQPDPAPINVVMPKLMSEELTEKVDRIQSVFINSQKIVDNYNIEKTKEKAA